MPNDHPYVPPGFTPCKFDVYAEGAPKEAREIDLARDIYAQCVANFMGTDQYFQAKKWSDTLPETLRAAFKKIKRHSTRAAHVFYEEENSA